MSFATPVESSRPRSIFATIILLMTLAMSVLLVGYAVFHLWVAAQAQRRDHERYVTTTLHFVRVELEGHLEQGETEETELAEIEDVVMRENASRRFGTVVLEIVDQSGNRLLATDDADALMEGHPPFPPLANAPADATITYWQAPWGNYYVLSGFRSTVDKTAAREVRIAIDWTEAAHKAERYRRRSLGAALICIILASFAAAFVTRHALRPLAVIRDAAENIRRGSFDERLEPERLPSELADLALSFARMQEHLQESFERLSQFAAELAHELRTPVNNLMGETEVTLSQERTPSEYKDVLASNLEEMSRLSRMIDSLLFLAHASRGSAPVAVERLDLADEADRVAEYHRAYSEDLGVAITRKGRGSIAADRTLLRRALSNLLANALEASSEGGTVEIEIREAPDEVRILVTDEGEGISGVDLPHVFERFRRTPQSRSRRPEGSGLGLSIVKSIAELHGGSVSIENRTDSGCVVSLTFPRQMTRSSSEGHVPEIIQPLA